MKAAKPEVWSMEKSEETAAPATAVWAVLSDVPGWRRWRPGVEEAELNGPLAAGVRLRLTLPESRTLDVRVLEVTENAGLVTEARINGVRVFIDHRIEPRANGEGSRVVAELEAFGPGCEPVGRAVAATFPAMLQALTELAEGLAYVGSGCEGCG